MNLGSVKTCNCDGVSNVAIGGVVSGVDRGDNTRNFGVLEGSAKKCSRNLVCKRRGIDHCELHGAFLGCGFAARCNVGDGNLFVYAGSNRNGKLTGGSIVCKTVAGDSPLELNVGVVLTNEGKGDLAGLENVLGKSKTCNLAVNLCFGLERGKLGIGEGLVGYGNEVGILAVHDKDTGSVCVVTEEHHLQQQQVLYLALWH